VAAVAADRMAEAMVVARRHSTEVAEVTVVAHPHSAAVAEEVAGAAVAASLP
jgi:hypothetical protein